MKPTHQTTPTSVIDPALSPAALLRGAALYLRRHGWLQGEIFGGTFHDAFPSACAIGAINICAHGQAVLSSTDGADDDLTDAAIRAMRILAAYLDPEYGTDGYDTSAIDIIGDWNDATGRTREQVVDILRDAAQDWDRLHTGGAR